MTESNCTVQLNDSSAAGAKLTVGRVFELVCDGDWSQFPADKAQFQLSADNQYKIKLLSAKVSPTEAHLQVTSYVAGDHQLEPLALLSGADQRNLHGVHFKTESVIDPKQQPPQEAFGPMGPLGLSQPWWYYGLWIFLALAIIAVAYRQFRGWQQKRKLVRELEAQGAALEPFPQFSQSLRRLQRDSVFLLSVHDGLLEQKKEFISTLEKSYRSYIGRSFLIPTFVWSDSAILKALKSSDRLVFDEQGEVVAELFREFAQAKSQLEKVKNQDLQQLLEQARKNIDAIHVLRQERKKTRSGGRR